MYRDQMFINFCCNMSICANSLWDSSNSGINIKAQSLTTHRLADHFPLPLPIEADLDPSQTQVFDNLCPGFVEHSDKSHLREHSSELMSSICLNSPTDSYIFRSSMSQISLGQTRSPSITMYHLSCIIHHPTPIMHHLSSNTYHASPLIYHLSFIIYHLASIIYHR